MMAVHRDAATTAVGRRARRGRHERKRAEPVEVERVPVAGLAEALRMVGGDPRRLRIVDRKTILLDASPMLVERVRRELRQVADSIEPSDALAIIRERTRK